jgi:hypothetical protein
MSVTNPTKAVGEETRIRALSPAILFATAVFGSFAVLAGGVATLPRDFLLPIAATLLLAMAAAAALVGWLRERGPQPDRLTYGDVAGALTLIGIGAAALMDPDQLIRMVEAPPIEK